MTKEEAKEKYISKQLCPTQCEVIIDSLYDDFENRICENCKDFTWDKNTNHNGYCRNEQIRSNFYIIDMDESIVVPHSFGCNNFKRKQQ